MPPAPAPPFSSVSQCLSALLPPTAFSLLPLTHTHTHTHTHRTCTHIIFSEPHIVFYCVCPFTRCHRRRPLPSPLSLSLPQHTTLSTAINKHEAEVVLDWSMSRLARALAKPFTVPVAMCTRHVAAMDEPLKRHIDAYAARGEDITIAVWREYVDGQRALLPYRWTKFRSEVAYLTSGQMAITDLTFADLLVFIRFLTKCLFIFIVAVMVGRRSVFPSLEPTSPFVEEIVKNWQPNRLHGVAGAEYMACDQAAAAGYGHR
ncbi:conserved hypothetical protein [Leishmania major strain Friedlin]|uniref:Uncharacterized protein n=1 Tax=Leishmania major TaxID=5664 RepID=Q4QJF3_LEIMA|nr:conserved hypothetical protein [Leishmania major strain Friedlin]CAG9568228.1 hypothetical_protein_-_conserved [Leishmania major strain Friedlin]CAJ01969.1 conserved hypothetical protein [Leishmania major strain Friedlin]|eukprot:XP_001687526.1 conserved hypothetical protein [Leishmania major strain Friedlin]